MKLSSWNFRQWLVFAGVLIVVGIVIWAGVYKYRLFGGQVASYRIAGQIAEISTKDSYVKITGIHIQKDGATTPEKSSQKEITVLVDANTKFEKTIMHRPSKEELAKTKGVWDMKKVKTEIVSGSLDGLPKGSSILVKTNTNNPTGASFMATEIDYYTIVD